MDLKIMLKWWNICRTKILKKIPSYVKHCISNSSFIVFLLSVSTNKICHKLGFLPQSHQKWGSVFRYIAHDRKPEQSSWNIFLISLPFLWLAACLNLSEQALMWLNPTHPGPWGKWKEETKSDLSLACRANTAAFVQRSFMMKRCAVSESVCSGVLGALCSSSCLPRQKLYKHTEPHVNRQTPHTHAHTQDNGYYQAHLGSRLRHPPNIF